MSISYKSVDAFKRILLALGPGKWTVEHHPKKQFDNEGDRVFGISNYTKKSIRLFKHAGHLDAIDTILHELLHAAYPDASEEEVLELTTLIAEELWNASA